MLTAGSQGATAIPKTQSTAGPPGAPEASMAASENLEAGTANAATGANPGNSVAAGASAAGSGDLNPPNPNFDSGANPRDSMSLSSHPITAEAAAAKSAAAESASLQLSPGERRLMERVIAHCDGAIRLACRASSAPPAFLAALTANESEGYARATRFEPGVYEHLVAVRRGERPRYGGITRKLLDAAIAFEIEAGGGASQAGTAGQAAPLQAILAPQQADAALRALSTSWSYTQIMGYHVIGRGRRIAELLDPHYHFQLALAMLAEFAQQYQLDLKRDFAELFHCWNTGQPYGPPRGPATYDPRYVENGLRRMEIYRLIGMGQK